MGLLQKVPSINYGSYLIMEKTKTFFWFVNISKYHHQEMGLRFVEPWLNLWSKAK